MGGQASRGVKRSVLEGLAFPRSIAAWQAVTIPPLPFAGEGKGVRRSSGIGFDNTSVDNRRDADETQPGEAGTNDEKRRTAEKR